ncbi:MAG: hypothetical protein OHK0022_20940 [Roseiflexaceae bacterium]
MVMNDLYEQQPSNSSQFPHYPGLEQLICAMLADQRLAAIILADPPLAINGLALPIQLSATERDLIRLVPRSDTVHDFAALLLGLLRPPLYPLAGMPQLVEEL